MGPSKRQTAFPLQELRHIFHPSKQARQTKEPVRLVREMGAGAPDPSAFGQGQWARPYQPQTVVLGLARPGAHLPNPVEGALPPDD